MDLSKVLSAIPIGLRKPLLEEYDSILQHFMEKRWTGAELSGGKFCEIVYSILDGYAKGVFLPKPNKPSNFVDACKKLENYTDVPRSFQILIPRMLPALYEIRNNRNVGHVGGDVDSNSMDANAVVAMASWVMGELIRVLHNTKPEEATSIVDFITNRKIPLVWEKEGMKRVLDTKMSIKNQMLLLIATNNSKVEIDSLKDWLDNNNKHYLTKILKTLHKDRMVNLSKDEKDVEILPLGTSLVEKIIADYNRK